MHQHECRACGQQELCADNPTNCAAAEDLKMIFFCTPCYKVNNHLANKPEKRMTAETPTPAASASHVAPTTRAIKAFESRGLNGQEGQMARIKHIAAHLWDALDDISIPPGNFEAGRLVALAKTELESSVMWGVKALSRNQIPMAENVPGFAR